MKSLSVRLKRWLPATHTAYVWLCVALLSAGALYRSARWERYDILTWDTAGYYAYLVSGFVTEDLGDGSYQVATRHSYRGDLNADFGMVHLPSGRTVFKYPMGIAIALAPWFGLAHAYARVADYPADGYALPYQLGIALGCWLYALLGLWLLGRELRHYFPDWLAALTLLCVGGATNWFCYATYEAAMPHGILFLLNVLLLCYMRQWYATGTWRAGLALAATMGLLVLARPTEAWMVAVPALWGLTSWAAVRERLAYWHAQWLQLAAMTGLALGLVGLQFVFWRVVGGQWLISFYPGETFDFQHPHLLEGLFSVRKGWLLYTPVMALALLGLRWTRRFAPQALLVLLLLVPLVLYVTYSWWDWGYGGSFSSRPLISLYPLLSFSLASFWARWWPGLAWPLAVLVLALVLLNLLQCWQYFTGLISCCETTWEMYKRVFLKVQ